VSITETIKEFQSSANDTGSSSVQIAIMTDRIHTLTQHFKIHKKDEHSRYGLLKIIRKRQKLLKYMKRTDVANYYVLIKKLGIRDK